MPTPDPKKWNFSGPKIPDEQDSKPFDKWETTRPRRREKLESKETAPEPEQNTPKFEPQITATSTIPDSDLSLWWKTLMGFVAEKSVTDILFSPESYEVYCRVGTQLRLYQCVGRENYDRLIYNRMTQDREATGGKHDIMVARKTEELQERGETDFAVTTFGRRMRVNVFKSLKGLAAAFRPLPNKSIPWRENGLSEAIMRIIDTTKQGLVLVTGPTGSGKCLSLGTQVLMHNGSIKNVEDICVGDQVMGPDSSPRNVLATTKGIGPLYRINPTRGNPWVCNDEHILTLKRSVKGKHFKKNGSLRNEGEYQAFGKQFQGGPGKFRKDPPACIVDVKIKDFIERSKNKKNIDQHWKLFKTGVNFPVDRELSLISPDHFYYLGLWLGDGTRKANQITSIDNEVISWVKDYSETYNFKYRTHTNSKNPNIKRIGASQNIERAKKRNEKYPFLLGKRSERFCLKTFLGSCLEKPISKNYPTIKSGYGPKQIPQWAVTASRDQRLNLLAGLLDSDGSLSKNCFDFVNKDKNFVSKVCFLSRSLGLWCSEPKEKSVNKKTYYRLTISGDVNIVPTKISRKKGHKRLQKKDPLVTGWTPEEIGEGDYYGFELDGDGRFLLGDFTVTHNSTTLCSMLEYVNEKYPYHIITIEDPIEYIFTNKKCVIDQREVEEHTQTFQSALRASLRENPDIIFVGELRDYETARTALMAADTGHLVFATLHTRRVYSTISRLLEMAPESSRSEMRAMISNAISMVICQRLLAKKGGGIYPCREIMMLNPAISSLIKEGKEKGISSQLTINQSKGMLEWGRAIELAVEAGNITKEEAEKYRDSTEDID